MIRKHGSIISSAWIVLFLAGCSSSSPNAPGGTSGATSGGGSSGSNGSGTAGSKAAGGSVGSGGAATAGSAGSSGSQTGGAPTSGGSGGTSGQGGASAGTGGVSAGGASAGSSATGGTGAAGGPGGITVKLDAKHQTIQGFGLNTALSNAMPDWDKYYTTTGAGLGLSIVRVGMTWEGHLSGAVPPSSYNAKIIGSVWTAPAECKDNKSTTKGGHLLTSCYDSWSTKIADFAKNNKLYAMGVANEPDFASCGSTIGPPCNSDYDTMLYTAKEMVAFIKVLAPKLKAANVKLMAPEASEWIHLWSNTSATGSTVASHPNSSDPLKCGCFGNSPTTGCESTCAEGNGYDYGHWLAKDAAAWAAIDLLGTHEYDSQKAEPWPADVDGGKRTKEIWQTEVSGVMYWPEQGQSSDINNGVAVAEWIHSALVVGEASAWLYWWYTASGDNEGLLNTGKSEVPKRVYTLGNFSKFVRPGYVMVDVTGNSNAKLLLSAYTGTEGTVVVAINKNSTNVSVPIAISGGTAPASCTPYLTAASASDNLKAGTAVPVSGGSFMASLVGTSVTTFVCK